MRFDLTILGSNSATPMHGRHPSAQVVCVHGHSYLIDCGEGTQMRMIKFRIKRNKLNHIFISHLHGDHCYGIFGLLGSFALGGRTEPLHVYAPAGLQEMFEVVHRHSGGGQPVPFPLHFHTVEWRAESFLIHEDAHVTVHSIPLTHGLPCTGFLFKEKEQPLRFQDGVVENLQLDYKQLAAVRKGADYVREDGSLIANADLTLPPHPPRSYAYCSDTTYNEKIIPYIYGVDLLYHEATYLHIDVARAVQYNHSTAQQAGTIATKAAAKRLVVGHFSSRYEEIQPILEDAQITYPNAELAVEGTVFEV